MRTLGYICYLPNQRSGHFQLDHLSCKFQFRPFIQPHHLFYGQPIRRRLLKRNAPSRRCRHRQRALHIYYIRTKGRLPVLQCQMRVQRYSVHGRSIHSQAQILSKQLDQCQCNVFDSWGCRYKRGSRSSCGRCFCELELCCGCYAIHRRWGGRAGMLHFE